MAAAGIAAANAYAATAAIPIIGPALAPAAAAEAMGAVMGFEGLAFAEQGMLLDRDRLVFAHKDEQILPANLSKGIQNIINNGGSRRGDVNITHAPTYNGAPHADREPFEDWAMRNGAEFRKWIAGGVRDGWFKA